MKKSIAIIGGGITGLTAAWELKRQGHQVRLLEHSHRPGGAIRSLQKEGYLLEEGPNTLMVDGADVEHFLEESGLITSLIRSEPAADKRYIVRDRRPIAIPMNPWQGITTRLWSVRGRLRILKELFLPAYSGNEEESLAEFVRRRLGQEMLDYAINPFVGGVYAGDPEKLSVKYGFPKLYSLERNFGGSLIRGAMKLKKQRKAEGTAWKTYLASFPGGLETMVDHLSGLLGEDLLLNAAVESLEKGEDGSYRISVIQDNSESVIAADAVLLAMPGNSLARLPCGNGIINTLSPVEEIPYPPVTTVVLGVRKNQVGHSLDGFGMLVPERESMNVLGTLFSSSLFPGRAPEGCALLTSFVGGTRSPDTAGLPDEELLPCVISDLRELINLEGDPSFVHFRRWPRAIPQYNVGYGKYLDTMRSFETKNPGCFIAGHMIDGIALPKCLRGGLNAARRINAFFEANHEC